ncbi:MAG TPA: TusE/DsrC/DsvC family sulfur relay protein, partial [Spirochaetes bacterium]|nr:TusE/DsrC/DsvC family sulfur relay protein [Spirochaetota bacterium]
MGALEVSGMTIPTDEDGFMEDTDQWSQEVAEFIAKVEGIDMTDAHWEVVNFLREYYTEYKIAPMIRILTKAIVKKLGK